MDLNKNKGNIYVTKYSATSIIKLKKGLKVSGCVVNKD